MGNILDIAGGVSLVANALLLILITIPSKASPILKKLDRWRHRDLYDQLDNCVEDSRQVTETLLILVGDKIQNNENVSPALLHTSFSLGEKYIDHGYNHFGSIGFNIIKREMQNED